MEGNTERVFKPVAKASLAAIVALPLALFGCPSGGASEPSGSNGADDEPGNVETPQPQYFEEDGGIVDPSSILDVQYVSKSTTTSNVKLKNGVDSFHYLLADRTYAPMLYSSRKAASKFKEIFTPSRYAWA